MPGQPEAPTWTQADNDPLSIAIGTVAIIFVTLEISLFVSMDVSNYRSAYRRIWKGQRDPRRKKKSKVKTKGQAWPVSSESPQDSVDSPGDDWPSTDFQQ